MRYVIVCLIKGEAGEFNDILRMDIYDKFKAKSSKLPAHFTIKAPFEYDGDISTLENDLEVLCGNEKEQLFTMKNYGHFDNRVVYMDVNMSREGQKLHDKIIDIMEKYPYIKFNKNDGRDKKFHVTLTSKKVPPIFNEVWEYVNKYPFEFKCSFDNIAIYKWNKDTWEFYKEFQMRKNNRVENIRKNSMV